MECIIGREQEKYVLEKTLSAKESEFLAIYGRRRVGKTFLIREFFKKSEIYFEMTGLQEGLLHEQLRNFNAVFKKQFTQHKNLDAPKGWNEALQMLIDAADKKKVSGKIVFFFDELPWLVGRKSNFLQALAYFWNSWAVKKKNVTVVVCGSAASWMIDNIVHNKGGLHNRITRRIRLMPFSLRETELYLKSRHIHFDQKQILDIYMVMGGVPHYLKHIEKGLSAAKNINQICFTKDGLLSDEFEKLYQSLFENSHLYIKVVKALAKCRTGLTRSKLLEQLQIKTGGGISGVLEALEESGFVARAVPFGKKSNDAVFKLIDEYSIFYLKWILKMPKGILNSHQHGYWVEKCHSPSWKSWSGLVFEEVCHKHIPQIKKGLGISGVNTFESSWFYKGKDKGEQGAQIDLLIDRSDQCISLCEMKYSDVEFILDKKSATNLRQKVDIFRNKTKTQKTIFIALITTQGAKENKYYEELISTQLRMGVLFDC